MQSQESEGEDMFPEEEADDEQEVDLEQFDFGKAKLEYFKKRAREILLTDGD